ncbi:hypothetical protein [Paenibacillus sp. FSL K6-2524]|uniref:hypothetical protein n=1 Tax=Paenibacillus sp. FSL K6-2524 TaxID=2954516 RepID=UPI0030FC81B7
MLLVEQALKLQRSYVFMEGESNRVGNAVLPDRVVHTKESGTQLFINLALEGRVAIISKIISRSRRKSKRIS